MYKKFYGLSDMPFSLTADPDYFFPGHFHSEARDFLNSEIRKNNSDIIILTGEVGSGKTVLLRSFLKNLGPPYRAIQVFYPVRSCLQLLEMILLDIGISPANNRINSLRDRLIQSILEMKEDGTVPVLVIDEAQNLGVRGIMELYNISKIKDNGEQIIKIVLAGQKNLLKKIERTEDEDLIESCKTHRLGYLSSDEIASYIDYRFIKAGCPESSLIKGDLIDEIYKLSLGAPRVVNMICDSLLLQGYISNNRTFTPTSLREVATRLFYDKLPGEGGLHARERAALPPDNLYLSLLLLENNARMKVHLENEFLEHGYNFTILTGLDHLFAELDRGKSGELQILIADAGFFLKNEQSTEGLDALDRLYSSYRHTPVIITSTLPLSTFREQLLTKGVPYLLKKPALSHLNLIELPSKLEAFYRELQSSIQNIYLQFSSFYRISLKSDTKKADLI